MRRQLRHCVALLLLATLGFAQVSVALAGCLMDRGEMAQMADEGCCDNSQSDVPLLPNDCLAHCTADLQLSSPPVALVHVPANVPLVVLPALQRPSPARVPSAAPPVAIPSRILLHAFLI